MGNDWRETTLGELCAEVPGAIAIGPFGSRMKADCYVEYGVPVIRGTNISDSRVWKGDWVYVSEETADSMPNCNVRFGDIVFPHRGSIGEVAIVPGDVPRYMLSTSLMKFTVDPRKADATYLFYYFRSPIGRHEILSYSSQVGTPGIGQPLASLKRFRVVLPPIEEQRPIAHILGTLDDKIELNRRMNETLEAMAQALFKSWFVDFDPVRAKLDGHPPIGLDSATAALFPSHFDHEAFGLAPKGWHRKRWGEIATLEYGKSLREYRDNDGEYRVFGTNGPIGFTDKALCNRAGIVIGRKGAYRGVHYSPEPFFVIDTAFYLEPTLPLDLKWVYYELLRFDINSMDSGSAIPSTSRDDFYGIPVILPPPEIQSAFGAIVGAWFAKIFANEAQSRTLATLRDALLPKLLSGELSVDS